MFTAAHYLHLLRFPILCGLTLAVFAPVAHHTGAASLLSGMFDLSWRPVILVSMCAAWLATACLFTTSLVLRYGHRRFDVTLSPGQEKWSWHVACVFYVLAAAIFLGYVWWFGPGGAWSAIGIGLLLWAATFWAVDSLSKRNVGMKWSRRITGWLAFSPKGYTDNNTALLDLHGRALAIALGSHFVYGLLGVWRGFALNSPDDVTGASVVLGLPTLACVLLLVTLICWTGGALTYFLDFYRIPLFVIVVAFLAVAGRWPQSDHFFDVTDRQQTTPLLPKQVLEAGTGDSAIIVAVSGGGIQAAAWSARVLTGLQEASQGHFAPAVRLVSSVSGGSVGTMHFLGAYRTNELSSADLPKIFKRAYASSLDDVAWGLIYPDLVRLVFPFFQPRGIGRGWALERAWAAGRDELQEPLANWRQPARAGLMPAVMFNSTIVETGARVAFSTFDWNRNETANVQPARAFHEVHSRFDVTPATAARLSASFPYVSPAARANAVLQKSQRFHFVDGGYWDNFGVASASEFIQQAVAGGTRIRHLLLIEIRDRATDDRTTASGYRGGLFQTIAPVQTLYNVRGNGQITRNQGELELLRGYLASTVTLTTAVFESPQKNAPLSWHLTSAEIDLIRKSWNEMANEKHQGFCTTMAFLRRASPAATAATSARCQP